jgi:hypothetical protein
MLLAIVAARNWHIKQLDINTTFLHGDLTEEVYLTPPQGLTIPKNKVVCKLQKSLYGLKQSSRQWNAKRNETLTKLGYLQSKSDYSLFTKKSRDNFTTVLLYVDDLVLAGNDIIEIDHVKQQLDSDFSIKDLGNHKFFLGFEVARNAEGICLYQRKYSLELQEEAGVLVAKPNSVPMDYSQKIHQDMGEPLEDPTRFRRMIRKRLFLTNTRLDIAFAVNSLSQYMKKPTSVHLQAAVKILKYIKQAPAPGLFFPSKSDLKLSGASASDWGGCLNTRRSTSGFCFFLGNDLIS